MADLADGWKVMVPTRLRTQCCHLWVKVTSQRKETLLQKVYFTRYEDWSTAAIARRGTRSKHAIEAVDRTTRTPLSLT